MKSVIIVGYNNFSKNVIDYLNDVEVILDDLTKDKHYNNIEIDTISNINKYLNDTSEIYVVDDMPYFDEVYYKLYNNGVDKINVIIKENIDEINENILTSEYIQTYHLKDKPLLRYIETHICDKCNLKCNGCSHFSNIVTNDSVTLESFKTDLSKLKSKFEVAMIRLMGGEPLLKQDLNDYIDYTRQKFPSSTIFIVTNGLFIKNMSKQVINSIKNNNVIINISLYKPTLKIINDIKLFLDNNKIKYRFGRGNKLVLEDDYILRFHTCLDTFKIKTDKKLTCYNQYCWFLRNGNIYKCPYPALINTLNTKYKTEFTVDDDDYFDLSSNADGWEIIKKLSKRVEFCDYCRSKIKDYDWNNNVAELNSYILGGKDGNIKS